MHYLIKEFLPPIANTLRWYSFKYGWKGNFKTFELAKEKCKGYNEDYILDRIIETTSQEHWITTRNYANPRNANNGSV